MFTFVLFRWVFYYFLLFWLGTEGFVGDVALPNARNELEFEMQERRDEEAASRLLNWQHLQSSSASGSVPSTTPARNGTHRRRQHHQKNTKKSPSSSSINGQVFSYVNTYQLNSMKSGVNSLLKWSLNSRIRNDHHSLQFSKVGLTDPLNVIYFLLNYKSSLELRDIWCQFLVGIIVQLSDQKWLQFITIFKSRFDCPIKSNSFFFFT